MPLWGNFSIVCLFCVSFSVFQYIPAAGAHMFMVISLKILYFVVGTQKYSSLTGKASSRLHQAFRPKTSRAYSAMFKVFVAFCVLMKVSLHHLSVEILLAFLECLLTNGVSVVVLCNYLSAIKAQCIMYDLQYNVCNSVKIKYFIKSVKISRPLCLKPHNVMDLKILRALITKTANIKHHMVIKAIILVGFFGFLRLSNMAPHSRISFDPSRHLTGSDVFFTQDYVKILLKWSKTLQTRDKAHVITLPRLKDKLICPRNALKCLFKLYPMLPSTSLFQIHTSKGWAPLIDSIVRKSLSALNVALGLNPHHFTFHNLRRSGATFAFNAHVPIQDIKRHGTWSSECIWTYIQSDHASGEKLAKSLASTIDV